MGIRHFLCGAFMAAVATQPFWAQDPDGTRDALRKQGLTPVKVGSSKYTDYGWFKAPFDLRVTKFEAKNKSGQTVRGYYSTSPWSERGTMHIQFRIY